MSWIVVRVRSDVKVERSIRETMHHLNLTNGEATGEGLLVGNDLTGHDLLAKTGARFPLTKGEQGVRSTATTATGAVLGRFFLGGVSLDQAGSHVLDGGFFAHVQYASSMVVRQASTLSAMDSSM